MGHYEPRMGAIKPTSSKQTAACRRSATGGFPNGIPERYGPRTRGVQPTQPLANGRRLDRLMDAIVGACAGDVQIMIDT
jgi:hypothetical protein